ncbi:hypothetical protein [Pseudomonas aeruginosa]|uniref:hypothetical protein n=1 Tax=Pseudomonas aeruginosa TaxID=287 RepID=UPI00228DCF71|nr:hypothetical protein [Pseudomonas aeruginosa]
MQVPLANNPNALFTLVNAPLAQAASETLIEVALFVWYAPDPLPSLKRALETLEGIQQRRARFALDVIRRYPCIELERQRALRDLVELEVSFEGGSMTDPLNAWGLDETETPNTKAILPYQTRHYAAERRKGVD